MGTVPYDPIGAKTERAATEIVDAAYAVHSTLGPGLLERIYESCLCHELVQRGLRVERQVRAPIHYNGLVLEGGMRLDLLVEQSIIVEIKVVESIALLHRCQILTYLKLTGLRLAFLINFNVPLIKQGLTRIVI